MVQIHAVSSIVVRVVKDVVVGYGEYVVFLFSEIAVNVIVQMVKLPATVISVIGIQVIIYTFPDGDGGPKINVEWERVLVIVIMDLEIVMRIVPPGAYTISI